LAFQHRLFNEAGDLLAEARVELVFVDAQSRRPLRAPEDFVRLFEG